MAAFTGGNGNKGGSYRFVIDVVPGQVINYSIGAPGAGGRAQATPPYSATAGSAGGNISVTVAGVTYTAFGGGGGAAGEFYGNEGAPPAPNGYDGAGGGTGGTGLGAFGGQGGFNEAFAGQPGLAGELLFENYQANGLISRTEWEVLINHLSERFTTYTWP
jgi:hypothetical protein